ncbi:MAG: class II aldolase/adducin family protein [Ruminococcaceae bacterium]|nr:class II aldolase/adducin family protein [Oscillospiraceae bacterium]
MTFDSNAINDVLTVAKRLDQKGILNAIEGNISVRKGDLVYITPSGKNKAYLTEDMISVIDMDGRLLKGFKASSEYKLHLHAYKLRADIGGMVHAHPTYLTAYALLNKPVETKAYPEMMVVYGSIQVAAYGRPGTDDIYRDVGRILKNENVLLLANHGAMAVGETVFDAMNALEAAESSARILTVASTLGKVKELSDEECQALLLQHEERMGR